MFTVTPHRPTRTDPLAVVGGGEHPGWCARTHVCGLGEHRAQPVTLTVPGGARVVLTRVLAATGREHVEVRTTITLTAGQDAARAHLGAVLAELDAHLTRVAALAAHHRAAYRVSQP